MEYGGKMFGLNDGESTWTPIGQVIDHIDHEVGVIKEYPFPTMLFPGLPADCREAWAEEAKRYKLCWNEKFKKITYMPTTKFTNYQVKATVGEYLKAVEKLNGSGKVLYKEHERHDSYDITIALDETILPSDGNALYQGYKLSTKHNGEGSLNAEVWTIRKVCVNGNLWGEVATADGHPCKISLIHTGKEELRAAQMQEFIGDIEWQHTKIKELADQAIATKFEYDRERTKQLITDYYGLAKKFGEAVCDRHEESKDNAGNWYGFIQDVTSAARDMYRKDKYHIEMDIQNKVQDMFARPGWLPEKTEQIVTVPAPRRQVA